MILSEKSCNFSGSCAGSAPDRALGADVQRIERVARRHEQAIALDAAEAEVGGALGERDLADPLAVGIEHHDAVERWRGAPAAPQIAVDVAAEAVRRLVGLARHEDA